MDLVRLISVSFACNVTALDIIRAVYGYINVIDEALRTTQILAPIHSLLITLSALK